MNSEKELRNKIILLSFFCSILVIYVHAYNIVEYGITNTSKGLSYLVYGIESYWSSLTKIAVPMFFFISGFLFFRNFDMSKLKYKYISRIKSILVPYLLWCTLYYLSYVLLTNIPHIKDVMNSAALNFSFISWIKSMSVDSYFTLWFLKCLMLYILLTPLIYLLLKNRGNFPIGNIVIVLLLCNNLFNIVDLPRDMEIYCVGSWIGINYKDLAHVKNKWVTGISIGYIILTFATAFKFMNICTEVLLLISIWFAVDVFNFNVVLPWWMHITFFTYLAHDIFLESLQKLVLLILGRNAISALLDYALTPIITLIILIGIAGIMKKSTPRLWKVLTGGR